MAGGYGASVGAKVGGSIGQSVGGSDGAAVGSHAGAAVGRVIGDLLSKDRQGDDRDDPVGLYYGHVEIQGVAAKFGYTDVSGLKMTTEYESVREGGNNAFEHRMIKGQKYDPLTIKRGFLSKTSDLLAWMQSIHDSTKPVKRATISVIFNDDDNSEELGRYNLYGAWISEYEGPSFNSSSKDIAFETIKISYDYYEYEQK